MHGRSQAHTLPTPSLGTPVPDAESVRQAALQASWRRDRAVGRRRLVWRWLVWLVQRHYPYLLVLLALTLGWPYLSAYLRPASPAAIPTRTPVAQTAPQSVTQPPTTAPVAPISSEEQPQEQQPESETPAILRASATLSPFAVDPEAMPAPPSLPTDTLPLKPENWLHSKEP